MRICVKTMLYPHESGLRLFVCKICHFRSFVRIFFPAIITVYGSCTDITKCFLTAELIGSPIDSQMFITSKLLDGRTFDKSHTHTHIHRPLLFFFFHFFTIVTTHTLIQSLRFSAMYSIYITSNAFILLYIIALAPYIDFSSFLRIRSQPSHIHARQALILLHIMIRMMNNEKELAELNSNGMEWNGHFFRQTLLRTFRANKTTTQLHTKIFSFFSWTHAFLCWSIDFFQL